MDDRVRQARVARLATVRPDGAPHVVPVTFAVVDATTVVTAVDGKPKRTRDLQRLRNLAADPRVSLLVDGWSEDWSALWWVRLDGTATVLDEHAGARQALVTKYAQYAAAPPAGPFVVVAVTAVRSWSGGRQPGHDPS